MVKFYTIDDVPKGVVFESYDRERLRDRGWIKSHPVNGKRFQGVEYGKLCYHDDRFSISRKYPKIVAKIFFGDCTAIPIVTSYCGILIPVIRPDHSLTIHRNIEEFHRIMRFMKGYTVSVAKDASSFGGGKSQLYQLGFSDSDDFELATELYKSTQL